MNKYVQYIIGAAEVHLAHAEVLQVVLITLITKVKRTALVTSHYADVKMRAEAAKMQIQVLPKQLASVVPIVVAD